MQVQQSICNVGKPWTEDELTELKELAAGNFPPCVISLRLGRPEATIESKAAELRIKVLPRNRPPYGDC
jgi:hypothetical protein